MNSKLLMPLEGGLYSRKWFHCQSCATFASSVMRARSAETRSAIGGSAARACADNGGAGPETASASANAHATKRIVSKQGSPLDGDRASPKILDSFRPPLLS